MAAVNLPDLNCPFGALKLAAITDTHIEDVYELVTQGLAPHSDASKPSYFRPIFKNAEQTQRK